MKRKHKFIPKREHLVECYRSEHGYSVKISRLRAIAIFLLKQKLLKKKIQKTFFAEGKGNRFCFLQW